jgi:hypothetical protein
MVSGIFESALVKTFRDFLNQSRLFKLTGYQFSQIYRSVGSDKYFARYGGCIDITDKRRRNRYARQKEWQDYCLWFVGE